ncbi:LysR substrate-binding domain-containing protein [Paenibacillus lutrae]|uniref:LysR family transcriptional regulator n=1 Tax=Paenibacillus lutrae TaxID=2078573 RepID=A0A7X3FF49_9BACL|nr:LysR family transcriptional regulator [Paenibacillus lutrae]
MELRQLQYFVKVARKQHMTQAAEELHVAQSAVSRQIRQLEEELGVQLFVQKGRNLQLTSAGRLFLSRAEDILNDLDRAVIEIQEFLDPEAGEIRVGFPHSVSMSILPSFISCFRQDHPNVKFRLRQGTYTSLIRDVMDGVIDLAIVSPCPESHEHVKGEVMLTEELFAVLPPSHPLAESVSIRLEQLREEPFVLFGEQYSLRPIVMNACQQAGFVPKIEFEGDETDTIRGLVAAGMGVSLLPELALRYSTLIEPAVVKIMDPKVTRTVGVIRRKGEKLPLVTDIFRQFLLEFKPSRAD